MRCWSLLAEKGSADATQARCRRMLAVSQSGYYAWKGRPDPPRTLRRIWLAGEIADVHKASGGIYGAHRVTAELRYGRDIVVGHNAVESIMREISDPRPPDAPAAARRQSTSTFRTTCSIVILSAPAIAGLQSMSIP